MPDLNELLGEASDADERVKSSSEKAVEAPSFVDESNFKLDRESSLRPWHNLEFLTNEARDSIRDWRKIPRFGEPTPLRESEEQRAPVEPVLQPVILQPDQERALWYSSVAGVVDALQRHAVTLLFVFGVAALAAGGLSTLMPSTYFSTLHLYAPEKTDSVSSRLQLFSNRIEFASFPVDFKVPLGLIARRLKSPAGKAWVLKHYLESHPNSVLDPNSVQAETFYAEGSELLVIEGYANDPNIAVEITNLYWDYLESEIKSLHEDNLHKVYKWIELTESELTQRIQLISAKIATLPGPSAAGDDSGLHSQTANEFAKAQLMKRKIEREKTELKTALQANSFDVVFSLQDSEIQDLRRVDDALRSQFGHSTMSREQLMSRANEILQRRLKEKETEYAAASDQLNQLRSQLSEQNSSSKAETSFASKQSELVRQQSESIARLEELEKLKNQIDVESSLSHSKLKPIQAATADLSTHRPSVLLKVAISLFAALLVSIGALVWLERRSFKPSARFMNQAVTS